MWFGSHCSERGGGGLCGKDVVAKTTASWSLRCEVSDMPPSTTERGMDVSGGCGAHTFVLGGITAILERIAPPPTNLGTVPSSLERGPSVPLGVMLLDLGLGSEA